MELINILSITSEKFCNLKMRHYFFSSTQTSNLYFFVKIDAIPGKDEHYNQKNLFINLQNFSNVVENMSLNLKLKQYRHCFNTR